MNVILEIEMKHFKFLRFVINPFVSFLARIIIIDVCTQAEPYCENLSQALSEFMLLHNNLPGIQRIKLISLFLLGQNTEVRFHTHIIMIF